MYSRLIVDTRFDEDPRPERASAVLETSHRNMASTRRGSASSSARRKACRATEVAWPDMGPNTSSASRADAEASASSSSNSSLASTWKQNLRLRTLHAALRVAELPESVIGKLP